MIRVLGDFVFVKGICSWVGGFENLGIARFFAVVVIDCGEMGQKLFKGVFHRGWDRCWMPYTSHTCSEQDYLDSWLEQDREHGTIATINAHECMSQRSHALTLVVRWKRGPTALRQVVGSMRLVID